MTFLEQKWVKISCMCVWVKNTNLTYIWPTDRPATVHVSPYDQCLVSLKFDGVQRLPEFVEMLLRLRFEILSYFFLSLFIFSFHFRFHFNFFLVEFFFKTKKKAISINNNLKTLRVSFFYFCWVWKMKRKTKQPQLEVCCCCY